MNSIVQRAVTFLPLVGALCANLSFGAELPIGIFSIDGATVGVTTLDEVQQTYGKAKAYRVGREDGANVRICYAHSASTRGSYYLAFESGVMGEFSTITGFRISTIRPAKNCVSTKVDIGTLETRNGIRLKQTLQDFRSTVPIEFKRRGLEFTYEAVNKRLATPEELNKLRANWPQEKQDYFDVTITIKAKFKGDHLIDFFVQKIESY
ncbi:MAG: hypothetical protein K2W84_09240 [Burkholderiales bacterium]|nr:hypothetical protein [Burkholderiales bacterium]